MNNLSNMIKVAVVGGEGIAGSDGGSRIACSNGSMPTRGVP